MENWIKESMAPEQKLAEIRQAGHLDGDLMTRFYALGEHWRSDLAFYADELRFLKNLMGSYFHHFLDNLNFNLVRRMENKLAILDRRREEVDFKVSRQLREISLIIQAGQTGKMNVLMAQQEELEELMCILAKDFRKLKKQIFTLTEEGLRHLQQRDEE